jgi:alkanesulfonate monooxygenase SsuD/methylene tetrahydromethanopterin reductase-like flavin-dependent oxidoreductase (luciferase family)
MRYHPAIVAQKAATVQILSGGRHDRYRTQAGARGDVRGRGRNRQAAVGQIAVAYGTDRDAAVKRAQEQFRWFGLGWRVNADLPGPSAFESVTQSVTPEQVAEQLPCGPDVDEHVQKIRSFIDAGFDEIALVQIGAEHQEPRRS